MRHVPSQQSEITIWIESKVSLSPAAPLRYISHLLKQMKVCCQYRPAWHLVVSQLAELWLSAYVTFWKRGLCTENLFHPLFSSMGAAASTFLKSFSYILSSMLFQESVKAPPSEFGLWPFIHFYLVTTTLSVLRVHQLLLSLRVEFTTSSRQSATTADFCSLYITTTSGHIVFSCFYCDIKLFNHRDLSWPFFTHLSGTSAARSGQWAVHFLESSLYGSD